MPTRGRQFPVIDQAVLKEVLNADPDLLLKRNYQGIFDAYQKVAKERKLRLPSWQGIRQVVGLHFTEWDTVLSKGGKLS